MSHSLISGNCHISRLAEIRGGEKLGTIGKEAACKRCVKTEPSLGTSPQSGLRALFERVIRPFRPDKSASCAAKVTTQVPSASRSVKPPCQSPLALRHSPFTSHLVPKSISICVISSGCHTPYESAQKIPNQQEDS